MQDEYLSKDELLTMKEILDSQLKALIDQSKQAVASLTEVKDVDADPLDVAVAESNREFTLRLADRERRLLAKIRYSIDRMQNGEYSTCEACGGGISYNRLLARPVATLCIDCKTEAEQLETRHRVF